MIQSKPLYQRIYAVVRQIPYGRVATYGQIAHIVGTCSAQMVGFALAALVDTGEQGVPWQRVINRQGRISPHNFGVGSELQRQLLISEGIEFDAEGRVDFERFGWMGMD